MHDVPGTAAVVWFGTGIVVKSADREGRVNDRPVRAGERQLSSVIWPLSGRTARPDGASSAFRYGVIGQRQGLAFGHGRIGAGAVKCLGRRVPQVQVPEDPFDDIGVVDERDDAHRGAAVGTLERIDLVNFLNQPGPAGFVPGVDRPFIDDDGCRRVAGLFSQSSRAPRAVGIVAVVAVPKCSYLSGMWFMSMRSHFRAGINTFAFQGGVQLGAVDDHAGLLVVAHLLEGEGTANHVPGKTFPAFGVGGFAADPVVPPGLLGLPLFTYSLRRVPLKLSLLPFCQGFPGSMFAG